MRKKQIVIALNGQLQGTVEEYRAMLLVNDSFFIAVDGGAYLLEELNILPDLLLGDFDSITDEELVRYKKQSVSIIDYPTEKDETDGELAIQYCLKKKLNDIIIIGARGGRLDQQLANIFLMEYASYHGMNVILKDPHHEMGLIDDRKIFKKCKGQILSLIPLSKEVDGVSIRGCKYTLEKEKLYRYKTRGISNIILEDRAEIFSEKGLLLYVKHL